MNAKVNVNWASQARNLQMGLQIQMICSRTKYFRDKIDIFLVLKDHYFALGLHNQPDFI